MWYSESAFWGGFQVALWLWFALWPARFMLRYFVSVARGRGMVPRSISISREG